MAGALWEIDWTLRCDVGIELYETPCSVSEAVEKASAEEASFLTTAFSRALRFSLTP